ncbi:hypothetical protein J2S43_001824 [Catenuloplanes nepalensis]|uniref:DUF4873 domain-containing protein n=1 Tax=Catenuloplanes nepalensis TaxID=587533 RepID=A0ABT9MPF3_9ACTN|nr:DUF4873 domain-containing protein [Catenuloplanes nepalensis]MDP9793312.1 hypothetical protein [Catenuloplanes nepalensis]
MTDEEYRGPAVVHADGTPYPVEVRMSARFEPVEGRVRWAGRTAPHAELRARVGGGLSEGRLGIGGSAPVPVRLSEPDPWGGVRLTGTGTPPWWVAS